jgi:hypothetical protein
MNDTVTNFAASLVEMAKAMERVPQLEAELSQHLQVITNHELRNTDLEVSLEASRRYAALLEQKVHDLEVANTAAELRFLETEDIASTLKSVLRRAMEEADGALKAIEPPTPVAEPVRTPSSEGTAPTYIETLTGEWVELRDTFQGVKSDPWPLQDGPLSPLPPSASHDTTPSTDASSDGAAKGESVHPLPIGEHSFEPPQSTSHADTADEPQSVTATDTSYEGVSVPSDSTPATVAVTESASESPVTSATVTTQTDPEPSERWTREWYSWNERRIEREAKATMSDLSPF